MNNKIVGKVAESVYPKIKKVTSQVIESTEQIVEHIPEELKVSEIPAEVIRAQRLSKNIELSKMSVEQLLEYFRKNSKNNIEAMEKMLRFQANKGSYDFKLYANKILGNGEFFFEGLSHNVNLMEGSIERAKGVKLQKILGNDMTYFRDEEGRIMLKCGDASVQSWGDYARDIVDLDGEINGLARNEIQNCIEHLASDNTGRINYMSWSNPVKDLNLKEVSKSVNINGTEVPIKYEGTGVTVAEDGRIFGKSLNGNDVVYQDLADLIPPPYERLHMHRIS